MKITIRLIFFTICLLVLFFSWSTGAVLSKNSPSTFKHSENANEKLQNNIITKSSKDNIQTDLEVSSDVNLNHNTSGYSLEDENTFNDFLMGQTSDGKVLQLSNVKDPRWQIGV